LPTTPQVDNEQALHVPVTSSHFETAFATMKSLVAGGYAYTAARFDLFVAEHIRPTD
jgi:hypothetical protein